MYNSGDGAQGRKILAVPGRSPGCLPACPCLLDPYPCCTGKLLFWWTAPCYAAQASSKCKMSFFCLIYCLFLGSPWAVYEDIIVLRGLGIFVWLVFASGLNLSLREKSINHPCATFDNTSGLVFYNHSYRDSYNWQIWQIFYACTWKIPGRNIGKSGMSELLYVTASAFSLCFVCSGPTDLLCAPRWTLIQVHSQFAICQVRAVAPSKLHAALAKILN